MFLEKHFKVWWLQILYLFVVTGFFSILFIYFFKNQISFFYIFLADFFSYVAILSYLLLIRRIDTRKSILLAYGLGILGLGALLLPLPIIVNFFIYIVLIGLCSIIFFLPYNILYFRNINDEKKLQGMTAYWGIGIVVGAIAPFLGGFILYKFGLSMFVVVAMLMLLFNSYLLKFVPQQKYKYSIKDISNHFKSLRTINIFDGALHKVTPVIIIIFSLSYITSEFDYGKFLSIIGLVALLVSLKIAKFSDKWKKRTIFLWPFSIMAGLVTISFFFVNNFLFFLILAVILKSLSVIIEPIRSNIVQDKMNKNEPLTWVSREIYLNIGRIMIVAVMTILVYFNLPKLIFLLLGSLHILFPFLVYYKKTYASIN